jgi:hypothetical protein
VEVGFEKLGIVDGNNVEDVEVKTEEVKAIKEGGG